MITRVLSGLSLLPLLLIVWSGGIPLYISGFILTIIAIKEFTDSLKVKNLNISITVGYLLALIFFLKNILSIGNNTTTLVVLLIIFLTILYALIKKISLKIPLMNLIGVLYIIFGFDAIICIATDVPFGYINVWLIFIIALLSDTMAYFVGSLFGKHKLAPVLSPKKTIEGSLGAIVFSIIGCCIFGKIFSLNISTMILVGFIGSIVSQIGDLLASFVKRYVGIKDYGTLIPGHGGILDRFDSIILVSQFLYIVLSLIK